MVSAEDIGIKSVRGVMTAHCLQVHNIRSLQIGAVPQQRFPLLHASVTAMTPV